MMKTHRLIALSGLLMLWTTLVRTDDATTTFGKTFFQPRSQGSNMAREDMLWVKFINRCDTDCMNGSLTLAPEYTQSFDDAGLGRYIWFSGTNTMVFGPAGNAKTTIFARNLLLNDDFNGTVTATPIVKSFIADLDFFVGLDEWKNGLYFRVHAPIVWTNWNTRIDRDGNQNITSTGTDIAAFALGNTTAQPSDLSTITEAFNGQQINTTKFPAIKTRLNFARIDGRQTAITVADVEAALGYNFICNEYSHLGINARAIFPTGTRPDGVFVFEPIIGNGRHYEVGAGITGHYDLWENCDSSCSIYLDGNFYYMFKSQQKRTFDLLGNGPGSRYLLLKKFDSTNTYLDEMSFGPNILTRPCDAQSKFHTDIVVMFDYQRGNTVFEVGYNLWYRTAEKVTLRGDLVTESGNWGVAPINGATDPGTNAQKTASNTTISGSVSTVDTTNVYITNASLDLKSAAAPAASTQKIFAFIGYIWQDNDYLPFLGIGGEAEFSGKHNNALSQFGVLLKGGFAFS